MDTAEILSAALDRITQLEKRVAKQEQELQRHEERTEGMSAQETYNRVRAYIDNNERVWCRIIKDAQDAVKDERRFSIAKEFELLRDEKWLERNENENYKCNNSYRACLTRFLLVDVPDLVPFVKLRRSKIDKFFPELEAMLNAA